MDQNPPLKPPPENLPTKDNAAQAISPPPIVPRPTSPGPISPMAPPNQPVGGFSNQPVPLAKPPAPATSPQLPVTSPGPPPLRTIRTMEDDLAALNKKSGPVSTPSRGPVAFTPSPSVRPPVLPPPPPSFRPPPPLQPLQPTPPKPDISPKVELNESAKVQVILPHPVPSKPLEDISLNIPPPSRRFSLGSPTVLIAVLAILAVAGFSAWFFLFYKSSAPGVGLNPTPTAILTPTATPLPPLETVFSKTNVVAVALSENFFTAFEGSAYAATIGLGEAWLYKINEPESGRRYGLGDFSGGTAIQAPADLLSALDDQEFYLTLMRKTDDKISYGFITKVADRGGANAALRNWEAAMANDLKILFGLDVTKAAAPAFLDNMISYPSVPIRYRNFPRPDLSIDYAIVPAPNGESYLVFANSREHIFTIIDKILTISATP